MSLGRVISGPLKTEGSFMSVHMCRSLVLPGWNGVLRRRDRLMEEGGEGGREGGEGGREREGGWKRRRRVEEKKGGGRKKEEKMMGYLGSCRR